MNRFVFLLLLTIVFLIGGCNKEKYSAPLAFYLKTVSADVSVSSGQGSKSSKITDIWLYTNGQFKGAYPIGATLPIISKGQTEITVFPGIKNNGISETRQPYEFYAPIEIDTAVNPNITVNRNFTFKYKSGTKFHYIEDFETWGGISGITIDSSGVSEVGFSVINNAAQAFEGSRSMFFTMQGDVKVALFQSRIQYSLPANGSPVYLELNYKCDQPFEIGVYNGSDFRSILTVNRSENWNKIYAQLSFGVSTSPVYSNYGFFIKAIKTNPSDQPEFYIDNLKLISY